MVFEKNDIIKKWTFQEGGGGEEKIKKAECSFFLSLFNFHNFLTFFFYQYIYKKKVKKNSFLRFWLYYFFIYKQIYPNNHMQFKNNPLPDKRYLNFKDINMAISDIWKISLVLRYGYLKKYDFWQVSFFLKTNDICISEFLYFNLIQTYLLMYKFLEFYKLNFHLNVTLKCNSTHNRISC